MNMPSPPLRRIRLLGADVDVTTPDEVLAFTERRIRLGLKGLIANHNAHSLALMKRSEPMRAFYDRADLIEVDSRPLIAWAQMMGQPLTGDHRSTYLDWRDQFWTMAERKGWRVFHLGGAPGVAEIAAGRIRARWPGLKLAVHHGYFDHDRASPDNSAVLAKIGDFAPDVIFVGMGMPLQEAWIAQNYDALSGVVFSIGGAFDYEAGVQPLPPRWIGRLGLEWLYRFATQPRRLFHRYFVEPWTLVPDALRDVATYHRLGRTLRRALRRLPLASPSS